jgi:RecA-family ATPase
LPLYRQNARFAGRGPLPKRTLEYLVNGAHPGSRNNELFEAALQFRDAGYTFDECWPRLFERASKDGLSEPEIRKAIESSFKTGPRSPIGGPVPSVPNGPGGSANGQSAPSASVGGAFSLPDPLPDGFRQLLEAAFEPEEYVALSEAVPDASGTLAPDAGQTLKRDKWIEAYVRGIFPNQRGVYLRINPMKPGGKSDKEVSAYRHALVEFDLDENGNRIPLETQYEAAIRSNVPITAITFSGDKSLHLLVRIDAGSRAEFDQRRELVWKAFAAYQIDPQNKNPSRYSRAPGFDRTLYDEAGAVRGIGQQELLALSVGAANWQEYLRPAIGIFVSGSELRSRVLPIPEDFINGIIAAGEKGQLAGGSKSYKTWSLIDQGLSVAAGLEWWGLKVPTGREVIYLNLELPDWSFEARLRFLARVRGVEIPDRFHVWHLRDERFADPNKWQYFIDGLQNFCSGLADPYLITDPIYRLLSGRNENASGDVEMLLWQLQEMILAVHGANFFGHHFAKGDSTQKEAIDRGAGSGMFGRDPDSLLVMTPHEKPGCFSVEFRLRNHEPLESFVIEWKKPLFLRDDSLDPEALKRKPRRGPQPKFAPSLIAKWLGKDVLSTAQLKSRLFAETGMSKTLFYDLLKEAEAKNLIAWDGQTKTWEVPLKSI